MRQLIMYVFAPLMVIVSVLFYSGEAQAIPAFARTHQVPCSLCHTGFPKLNQFGMDFKQRGYRMPGQEGKYLWDQPIPLSGSVTLSYKYLSNDWSPEVSEDMDMDGTPDMVLSDTKSSSFRLDGWDLFAGGTLTPTVSFLGTIRSARVPGLEPEAGGKTEEGESDGVADTGLTEIETEVYLVQINDLLADGKLNLRIGKDHADNYFLSLPRRLTQADYLLQIQPMLGPSLHPSSVGAELNGFIQDLRYAAGIRNYGPAYDSKDDDEQRVGAWYAWASKTISGQTGSIMISGDRRGDANTDTDDNTLGYGLALDLYLGKLNVIPAYFWYQEGSDIRNGNELNATSGTIEAIYPLTPEILCTLRYDFNNWDIENDGMDRDARQYVVNLAWYQFPNVRWMLEYSHLNTSNLMVEGSPGDLMLEDTGMVESDLKQDKALLALQVTF